MSGTDEYPGMLFPLGQADNALRLAGLKDDDLFRVELRQAIKAFAELITADREYDRTKLALLRDRRGDALRAIEHNEATNRRAAALEAVGGEVQG